MKKKKGKNKIMLIEIHYEDFNEFKESFLLIIRTYFNDL